MLEVLKKRIVDFFGKPLFWSFTRSLVVVSLVPTLWGQNVKQSWAYTFEERVALRTDVRLAAERVRGSTRVRVDSQDPPTLVADSFDGSSHAELFLPYEVFRTLVRQAYLGSESSASRFRQANNGLVSTYGLPGDFWERLAGLSALYANDARSIDALGLEFRQAHARGRAVLIDELTRRQLLACSSRTDALTAARREFGQERFDRFLYEVIAVHMFQVSDELPRADDLRYAERGCR